MFLTGIPFAQARYILEKGRYVELWAIVNENKVYDRKKEDHTAYIGLLESYAQGATVHRVLPPAPRVEPIHWEETQPTEAAPRPLRKQSERVVFAWPAPMLPQPRPEGDDAYGNEYPPIDPDLKGRSPSKAKDYRKKVRDYSDRNVTTTLVVAASSVTDT